MTVPFEMFLSRRTREAGPWMLWSRSDTLDASVLIVSTVVDSQSGLSAVKDVRL